LSLLISTSICEVLTLCWNFIEGSFGVIHAIFMASFENGSRIDDWFT
jgi:hypothetical protein